jgi:hypothetical protein
LRSDPSQPALRAWSQEIDAVLAEQLARIRRRFLVHGFGWVVAAAAIGLCLYYGLDRVLELPAPVRVITTLVGLTYVGLGVERRLRYPLRRAFGRDDVAIAIERRFPELREQLVTAHELKGSLAADAPPGALRDQSADMVARVVEEAAARIRTLPIGEILTPRRTVRVWSIALAGAISLAALGITQGEAFRVFVLRSLGLAAEYPRRTQLFIELPEDDAAFRITRGEGTAEVRISTGADLPVLVRAEGVIPREAFLVVAGGRGLPPEVAMAQRPGERFRHVFRRVQSDFSFHARGGDDPRGDLEVFVRTIDPPLVGTIETELTYPAYTGLAPASQRGGAVEALIGTEVRVVVRATTPVERAALHFLDSDAPLELTPIELIDDSGVGQAFEGRFTVTSMDRYQVELVHREGLTNPRPGTYPVVALEDHGPVGRVLLPASDDVQVVLPTGRLPVRIEAKDDFGLARVTVEASTARAENASEILLYARDRDGDTRSTVTTVLLDVDALEPGEGPRQGDTVALGFALVDNREPEQNRTELARRQVYVVDAADLARRIAGHFRRVRDQVERALDQQRTQSNALEGLLEELPDPRNGRDPRLVTQQVGQARVVQTLRRIRDDLMQAYDVHLFNGLEGSDSTQAPRVEQAYLDWHRARADAVAFDPGFYRQLGRDQAEGRIGPMEQSLDPILDMVLRTDRIVEADGQDAMQALDEASVAGSQGRLGELLAEVGIRQTRILNDLELLLGQLDEWNEFQDVVQQARALRDAQRDIEYRTRTLGAPDGDKR